MTKFWERIFEITIFVITIVFMFLPESFFEKWKIMGDASDTANIIFNRLIIFVAVFVVVFIFALIYYHFRTKIYIRGKGYRIQVEYGDIFEAPKEAKKVIAFDECFTTEVGDRPEQIKPDSVCGQYLTRYPLSADEMQRIIDENLLNPMKSGSKYKDLKKYEPGRIVQNGNYFLVAFVKLDEKGVGEPINRKEYLDFLFLLWKEINVNYAYKDVYMTIIGSGLTRKESMTQITQQELLDIIIESYKLSNYKIDLKNQLHIVCKRCDGFSLNNIGKAL